MVNKDFHPPPSPEGNGPGIGSATLTPRLGAKCSILRMP
jgi:hypothetical protein